MEIKFEIKQIDEVVEKYLMPVLKDKTIFTFSGPLGAGKTTLIKRFLKKCGIKENITSPTFNYVNTYKNDKGQIFNHFDLYRIEKLDDFLLTGFDEFLYRPNEYNLIEWPGVIEELLKKKDLKEKALIVSLKHIEDLPHLRLLNVQKIKNN